MNVYFFLLQKSIEKNHELNKCLNKQSSKQMFSRFFFYYIHELKTLEIKKFEFIKIKNNRFNKCEKKYSN
jgi:hypothetical protein